MKKFFNSGQSLVELLITIGLSTLLLPALIIGLIASQNGKNQEQQRIQAVALLKEAQEAVRVVREANWTALTANGTYHPVISGSTWTVASGAETINGFTRQLVLNDVYRATPSGAIISGSNGWLDPSTKQIVSTVSWNTPITSSVTATMYITRYTNTNFVQTTVPDFSAGTVANTTVTATSGTTIPNDGQVQLASGGSGNWCNPGTSVVATYDLPGQGVVQAISATSSATQDVAYTTTGSNASGDAVDALTISHANPPVITNPASSSEAKAYGIFVDNAASYVYFNENNPPNHTVRIANASDLSDLGYFDVSHATGTSIFVSGNTGYTTSGSTLYSFDVSAKTGSRPQLDYVNLAGTGNKIVVVGTNAYVATSSTTNQLQIIDVSNPSDMALTKSITVGNGQGAVDVFVNSTQTYAYIVTSYASGKNDFFIVDLHNTSNIYGYTTNGMNPKGITVVPGNKAIIVGSGGTLYQVFDITTPSAASYCGGMNPSGVTTISAVAPVMQTNGNTFSYIITDNSSAEFQIIAGGPGGQFSSNGTFTSTPFMATTSATFNYFSATVSQPSQTTLSLQVASTSPVNNSCAAATYTYVGPDGTPNTFFTPNGNTLSGQIPVSGSGTYKNPAQCFEYKAFFSASDQTQSPVLYDMTVSYSP